MDSENKTKISKLSKCKKLSKSKCCKNNKKVKKVEDEEDSITDLLPEKVEEIKCVPTNIVSEFQDEVEFRTLEEIYALDNSSVLQQDLKVPCHKTIFLTKKEKNCLEEIKTLISKMRLPTDDRQKHLFNRDVDKFSSTVSLLEIEAPQRNLNEAAKAIEESPSNIVVTDLNAVAIYLNELKTLIAKREVAWAAATESSYSQKLEIFQLKSKVDHLKTICAKRQNEIAEKDKIIENKDSEILKLKKINERLKFEIIQLAKNRDDENVCIGNNGRQIKDLMTSNLGKLDGKSNTVRKNNGPAALLANALYKARNRGHYANI